MLEGIANNKVLQNKCGRDRKLFKIICMDALTIMDVNCPLQVTSKKQWEAHHYEDVHHGVVEAPMLDPQEVSLMKK